MRFCSRCGISSLDLLRCSKCKSVYYCSVACQKLDWKRVHKKSCKQLIVIDQSSLPFKFLNPRSDRFIVEHGNQSHQVSTLTSHILKMLEKMKMNSDQVAMMMVNQDLPIGAYGRCFGNVEIITEQFGGESIAGWMLFENEFMIEAEAHCAWKPDGETYLVNVTPSSAKTDIIVSGYFIMDPSVWIQKLENPTNIIPNFIYWKD